MDRNGYTFVRRQGQNMISPGLTRRPPPSNASSQHQQQATSAIANTSPPSGVSSRSGGGGGGGGGSGNSIGPNPTVSTGNNSSAAIAPTIPETVTQHDELIRYIKEAWHKVTTENGPHGAPVIYRSDQETPRLPGGFTPFDLEGYWGQRLVQNIQITQGHQ